MDILKSLGLNGTVWIQLGFFLVSYFFLSRFLFKPYREILEHRRKNTGGALNEATQLNTATDQLATDYQEKMKSQNEKARSVFSKQREDGLAEEEKMLAEARKSASSIIDATKKDLATELMIAKENLRAQIPQMSELIASQLLGRNLDGK